MAVTFETVRQIALSLDRVEEGTSYGTLAFKVGGALFVRFRPDIDSLVVPMDHEQRRELMADDPETCYITDHYLEYPWVLVRLSRVHPDALARPPSGGVARRGFEQAACNPSAAYGWARAQ